MALNFYKKIICTVTIVTTFNVNASFYSTLDGVNYEWMEITATQGLARSQVEPLLTDSSHQLYGYQYASRDLVQKLFLSYSTWDGLDGYHGDPATASGVANLVTAIGSTYTKPGDGINSIVNQTVDGYSALYDGYRKAEFIYGEIGECRADTYYHCRGHLLIYTDANGLPSMSWQHGGFGYDAMSNDTWVYGFHHSGPRIGSLLVRETVVPLPPSIWLFSFGLISLLGTSRYRVRVIQPYTKIK